MLDAQQSKEAVEEAIFQAGGFQGPFADADTLTQAGLVTDSQRIGFQPHVRKRCRARSHDFADITLIPNGAGTKVSEVAAFVQQNAARVSVTEA